MSSITVKAPNEQYSGTVAGVTFTNGEAKADDEKHGAALAYFRRAGYVVGSPSKEQAERLDALTPDVDRNAEAPQTFPGEGEGERSRVDVAVPPYSGPGSGIEEWKRFAKLQDRTVDLTGLSRDDIIALSRQRSWA